MMKNIGINCICKLFFMAENFAVLEAVMALFVKFVLAVIQSAKKLLSLKNLKAY